MTLLWAVVFLGCVLLPWAEIVPGTQSFDPADDDGTENIEADVSNAAGNS